MGFLSPGLGFASTAGAFIGGAAKQMNANIVQANQSQALHDQAWGIKVDKAVQDWNKQYKSDQQSANIYNAFKSGLGDDYLADRAYQMHLANPKMDIQAIMNEVRPAPGSNYTAPQGYKSSVLSGLSDTDNTQYQNLEGQINNLPGNIRPLVTQPIAPGGNDFGNGVQDLPNVQYTPTGAPTNVKGIIPPFLPPTDFHDQAGYHSYLASRQANPNDPSKWDTSGMVGADQMQANKLALKPPSTQETPSDKANLAIQTKASEDYLTNPKYGLGARYNELRGLQGEEYDVNSMIDVLNRGFKASAPQALYDNLNRYTTSVLGVSLSDMGISNTVSDTNLLRKEVSNAIIEKLKTLHFGRITNYEAGLVKQGFTSEGNDPNTNIKITLMLKALIDQSFQATQAEYNAVYENGKPTMQSIASGRKVAGQYITDYSQQHTPWAQINSANQTQSEAAIQKLPAGTWFEDTATGTMYRKN